MSVDVAYDIWTEFRRFLSTPDRAEAADALVNVLIDNDYDAEDIRSAFKGDADVKRALQSYLDDAGEDPEEDSEDYDEDEY
jgi:tryptophanase